MICIEKAKKCKKLCCGNITLLYLEAEYVKAETLEEFFEKLCENCFIWAEEKLFPRLESEYNADKDPKKRFTKGYEYRVTVIFEESLDGFLTCRFSSYLKKRGSKDKIFENEYDFTVRERDGCIIPQKYLNKLKKRQDKQKAHETNVENDEK